MGTHAPMWHRSVTRRRSVNSRNRPTWQRCARVCWHSHSTDASTVASYTCFPAADTRTPHPHSHSTLHSPIHHHVNTSRPRLAALHPSRTTHAHRLSLRRPLQIMFATQFSPVFIRLATAACFIMFGYELYYEGMRKCCCVQVSSVCGQ
jgi:hypothetical protein